MTSRSAAVLLFLAFCAIASPAMAQFVVRAGDLVYVDGKQYSWEEWKKIRDTYQPPAVATALPANAPLAASCVTSIYYDEFPSDDERFQCTSGVGALTRQELQQQGWKVDLIEKIPPPTGSPSQSTRGLPLSRYKLVLSRSSAAQVVQPAAAAQSGPAAAPRARRSDLLCMQDCLGTGGTRPFCEDRCTD